jgi:hypothetical protein
MENKEVEFHNVKILVDLESTNQWISYEELLNMAPFGTVDFKTLTSE